MVSHYFALYLFKVFCQFQYQCTKLWSSAQIASDYVCAEGRTFVRYARCEPQRSTHPIHHTDLSVKAIHISCTSLGISYARYACASFFSCTTPRLPGPGWETKSATPELLQTPSRGVSLCVLGHSSSSLRLISLQSRLLPIKSPSLLFNQVSAYGGEFTS